MSQNRGPYRNVGLPGKSRCNTVDMQEIMKREIYRQGAATDLGFRPTGAPEIAAAGSLVPSAGYGFIDSELYFDSLTTDVTSNLPQGELNFSITDINGGRSVDGCIEVSLGSFYFPKVNNPAGTPDLFYYRRMYMQIASLPNTSGVQDISGTVYHFEFEITNYNSIAVLLVPLKRSIFFQGPLTSLTSMQFVFMVPTNWQRVPIPAAMEPVVSVAGSNPAQFVFTSGDLIPDVIGPVGTPTAPGYVIYISGFNSANPTLNAAVNTVTGVYITDIINDTTFEVGSLNFTGVPALTAQIVVPQNRIAFPVRFTTVASNITNHIGVHHE